MVGEGVVFMLTPPEAAAAQRAQMQASRCASTGTQASNSDVNTAVVHQQGLCGTPVARSASFAQTLLWPHKGHRLVSMARGAEIWGIVVFCVGPAV